MKIHPQVIQIRTPIITDSVELYLIRGERNAIIDTGTPLLSRNDIAPALKDLGLTLDDIDLVLNTHGHFNHTGGDSAVKSMSSAQILIHTDEIVLIEDHERYFEEEFRLVVEAIMGKEHVKEERKHFLEMAGSDVVVDR